MSRSGHGFRLVHRQTVSADGQPLSHDILLDAIEGVEISFEDDGTARMPTLVMHPNMAEKLAALPPATPEQERRFQDIMQRKQEAFFAGRRSRRLS